MGREDQYGFRSSGAFNWPTWPTHSVQKNGLSRLESGGREGIRTPGLLVANEALSQLSYSPTSSREILANVGEGSHLRLIVCAIFVYFGFGVMEVALAHIGAQVAQHGVIDFKVFGDGGASAKVKARETADA